MTSKPNVETAVALAERLQALSKEPAVVALLESQGIENLLSALDEMLITERLAFESAADRLTHVMGVVEVTIAIITLLLQRQSEAEGTP